MSDYSIFYSLVAVSVALTLSYLSKATNKDVKENEQGQYLLRMHKLYFIVGIIALVFAGVFIASPLFVDNPDIGLYITIFCMLLLFGGLGILSVLYFKKHYVLFDETTLKVGSPFGGVKSINWNEITKAKFSPVSGLLTLTGKAGERVKIHYHLIGFTNFVGQLEKKTGWTAEQLNLPTGKNSIG
ncbi:MAG TPA: hypothetical protein VFR58_03780 [Flavisolibacter sp.]|nr:hypothetical protein [Flavisolibacter sp.]